MQVRTYTLLVTVMTDPASKACPRIPSPAEMATRVQRALEEGNDPWFEDKDKSFVTATVDATDGDNLRAGLFADGHAIQKIRDFHMEIRKENPDARETHLKTM